MQQVSTKFLLEYYYELINHFYLHLRCKETFTKDYLNAINTNSKLAIEIFGKIVYDFISGFLINFDNNSPLNVHENTDADTMRKNMSQLNAFIIVFSQKLPKNHFNALLFKNHQSIREIGTHWNDMYFPDMIMPENKEINVIQTVLAYIQKLGDRIVYKCGEDCNYYFVFEDCGKPGKDSIIKCPYVCND